MPKYGSLYTPFSTSTAKTVLGAEVEYQPSVEKPAAEICFRRSGYFCGRLDFPAVAKNGAGIGKQKQDRAQQKE